MDTHMKLRSELVWTKWNRVEFLETLLRDGILRNDTDEFGRLEKLIRVQNAPFVFIDIRPNAKSLQKLVNVATNKTWMRGEELPIFNTRWHFLTKEE